MFVFGFFFLPLLSDLMEFRRKLFLGKARDEKCGMSQPEGSITPLSLPCCSEAQRGTVAFPATHSTLMAEAKLESGQRSLTGAPWLAAGETKIGPDYFASVGPCTSAGQK